MKGGSKRHVRKGTQEGLANVLLKEFLALVSKEENIIKNTDGLYSIRKEAQEDIFMVTYTAKRQDLYEELKPDFEKGITKLKNLVKKHNEEVRAKKQDELKYLENKIRANFNDLYKLLRSQGYISESQMTKSTNEAKALKAEADRAGLGPDFVELHDRLVTVFNRELIAANKKREAELEAKLRHFKARLKIYMDDLFRAYQTTGEIPKSKMTSACKGFEDVIREASEVDLYDEVLKIAKDLKTALKRKLTIEDIKKARSKS